MAESIMSGKQQITTVKAYTGMSYGETSTGSGDYGMGDFFGFEEQAQTYVYIAEVIGNNATKAGFKANDIVLSVDGKDIDSVDTLKSVIQDHKPGDKVKYEILRGNSTMTIELKLDKAED